VAKLCTWQKVLRELLKMSLVLIGQ